jgi:hypothetical protein
MASFFSFLLLGLLVILLALIPSSQWSFLQLFRSIFGRHLFTQQFQSYEQSLWFHWESHSSDNQKIISPLPLPIYTSLSDLHLIDLTRPFLIKNLTQYDNILTLNHLLTPPISESVIDYFIDARTVNTIPNSRDQVRKIVEKIMNGGPEKIGTQMIIKSFPEIIERFVDANKWLENVFGQERVRQWRETSPVMTYPVFVSRGRSSIPPASSDPTSLSTKTTRTDLHCEPISNVVLQTVGKKKWTLVEAQYSHLIRPTISPDGRAYFYSSLDPFDSHALDQIPHYEVITEEGDLLSVPTWTWHRVDYLPDVTAVSISIFQFIPLDFVMRNPLFALTLVPNLIKEAVGIKEQ